MPYQRQILLSSNPVPLRLSVLLSACAHVVGLVLLLALRHGAGPHIVVEKSQMAQLLAGTPHLAFHPAEAKAGSSASPFPPRSRRRARRAAQGGEGGTALQRLRERARTATAGMVANLKVRQFYGFSTEHWDLAMQTAGALPVISADELPPRFEQYITVEVTIDEDGRVADARIIGGEAPVMTQQRLLAAIRQFKYSPAKRDGTPIPSQVDIIVHIPS